MSTESNRELQSKYPWADNTSKLERAVSEVLNSGQKESNESVKAVYVRLLGKVVGEGEVETGRLEDLSFAELKKLAKEKGVKATGSKDDIIKALKASPDDDDDDEDVVDEDDE